MDQGHESDVGLEGYIRFKCLYLRSEYRARVSDEDEAGTVGLDATYRS